MMAKVLLLGATGGIGSQTLQQLLDRGVAVTAIVRSEQRLPGGARGHKLLTALERETGALGMPLDELAEAVRGCDAVVSCLGHNMSLRGMFGHPRGLCVDTTRHACDAIKLVLPDKPIKLIVVNTVGVDHPAGTDPPRGRMERLLIWLIEVLLPPMADNVKTLHYLHNEASKNPHVEYCAVRPDDLLDSDKKTEDLPPFAVHETLQNGLFNAGVTTRANVGRFMADLVTEPSVWTRWRGKFPQILDVVEKK
eukprot:Tamp_21005.p1 GENE.Tamp_21005~~Tamp_21005.p1  ORF type:complete len:251 (-),score=67.59 Tamp_21005:358-1110(-)